MKVKPFIALALTGAMLASMTTFAREAPKMKMTTDIPASIMAPDSVETSIGTLEYFDGVPKANTVETMAGDFELDHSSRAPGKAAKIYDLMDHSGPASSTSGDFRYVARNGRKYRPAFLMLASPIYE